MILWTIQTSEAWKRLQEKGVLRADDGRISEDMRLGYGWMEPDAPPPGAAADGACRIAMGLVSMERS
ncbi:MAG TPA: hypothetical protein DCS05_11005 [Nitrospiraceae bacterium]|nr:hypothetical protein [Nitrospiraceae bacterium]